MVDSQHRATGGALSGQGNAYMSLSRNTEAFNLKDASRYCYCYGHCHSDCYCGRACSSSLASPCDSFLAPAYHIHQHRHLCFCDAILCLLLHVLIRLYHVSAPSLLLNRQTSWVGARGRSRNTSVPPLPPRLCIHFLQSSFCPYLRLSSNSFCYTSLHNLGPIQKMSRSQGHAVGTTDVDHIEAPVSFRSYLICVFASFGGILFGYDSGYISGVLGMVSQLPVLVSESVW